MPPLTQSFATILRRITDPLVVGPRDPKRTKWARQIASMLEAKAAAIRAVYGRAEDDTRAKIEATEPDDEFVCLHTPTVRKGVVGHVSPRRLCLIHGDYVCVAALTWQVLVSEAKEASRSAGKTTLDLTRLVERGREIAQKELDAEQAR